MRYYSSSSSHQRLFCKQFAKRKKIRNVAKNFPEHFSLNSNYARVCVSQLDLTSPANKNACICKSTAATFQMRVSSLFFFLLLPLRRNSFVFVCLIKSLLGLTSRFSIWSQWTQFICMIMKPFFRSLPCRFYSYRTYRKLIEVFLEHHLESINKRLVFFFPRSDILTMRCNINSNEKFHEIDITIIIRI